MSGLRYKSNGTLDMRYSSSRQAVASASGGSYSSSSSSSNNLGRSSYSYDCGPSRGSSSYGSSSGQHYKKDGSLDMRYSSSKQAVTSGDYGYTSSSRASASAVSDAGNHHYKKDGSLDMRYSSSKQAVTSGDYGYTSSSRASASAVSDAGNHHYKKDGSLDMRYSSSKQTLTGGHYGYSSNARASLPSKASADDLHYKKDGSLDLRYKSSTTAAAARSDGKKWSSTEFRKHDSFLDDRYNNADSVTSAMNKMRIDRPSGIPSHIPLTKLGLPDMRTNAARDWVASQAQYGGGDIPSWIPTHKDGSLDATKAVAQEFLRQRDLSAQFVPAYRPERRREYYSKKKECDALFRGLVWSVRETEIESEPQCITRRVMAPISSRSYRQELRPEGISFEHLQRVDDRGRRVEQITISDVQLQPGVTLGKGGFGVVYKGSWRDQTVAVKMLHMHKLSRKDKQSFLTEIQILEALSDHPNLVKLLAYSLDQPSLILEFVELGSLHDLIHFNEDPEIEAKITDGRIKKRIAMGIVYGMICLHEAKVVHGDLKPQNILVTKTYEAKITDFGLATIRGKTSATAVAPDEGHAVGGTAAYMAPELLDSSDAPSLNTDVYSFGIVLNEILHEEEPFADQYYKFIGRGPFAAVNHAKLGNRPRTDSLTPEAVKKLIQSCWNADPRRRPTFQDILFTLKEKSFIIPNFT